MSVSIFPNAKNPRITGKTNNFVAGNVIYKGGGSGVGVFDLLLERCALDALVDSSERFDPPRCAEETRQMMIHDISSWVTSNSRSPSVLWLYGSAGAGKSAICQTVAEIFKKKKRLLASFFFSRTATSSNRSDGNYLVPTLAYQLTLSFPTTRPRVETCILRDPAILHKSRSTQMARLFTDPLQQFSFRNFFKTFMKFSSGSTTQLIVIDGLDECHDAKVQRDILKVIASTVQTQGLRVPLRFLIASRPESHIKRTFEHDDSFRDIHFRQIDLDKDLDVRASIKKFLLKEFQEIHRTHPLRSHLDPSWPSEAIIDRLLAKSSSQFIYASTVINYIKSTRHRPDTRLQVIIGISSRPAQDKPFAELDALYNFIFSCVEQEDREMVWRILGIMHLANQWSSIPQPSSASLEMILGLKAGDVQLLLDPLSSVISYPSDPKSPIVILHASLFDFLLDASRSLEFTLNLPSAHEALAKYYAFRVTESIDRDFDYSLIFQHGLKASLSNDIKTSLMSAAAVLFDSAFVASTVRETYERPGVHEEVVQWVVRIFDTAYFASAVFSRENFLGESDTLRHYLENLEKLMTRGFRSGLPTAEIMVIPEDQLFTDPSLNMQYRVCGLLTNFYAAYWQKEAPIYWRRVTIENIFFKYPPGSPSFKVMATILLLRNAADAALWDEDTVVSVMLFLESSGAKMRQKAYESGKEDLLQNQRRRTVLEYLRSGRHDIQKFIPRLEALWTYEWIDDK